MQQSAYPGDLHSLPSEARAVPAIAHPHGARFRGIVFLLTLLGTALLCSYVGYWLGTSRSNASIVTINGEGLSERDFLHRCQIATGTQTLQQMILEQEQLQFARKLGVFPPEKEVEAKFGEASRQPDFARTLASSHQTADDVRHSIRVNLAQAAVITKDITVSENDIRDFYVHNTDKKNPGARYYTPEAVLLAVIVSDTEADAKKALHELASGADFGTVAAHYSKDTSASNGGLLSIRRGQMSTQKFPGLENRLFAMQVGQQLDLLPLAGKWWIIRCVGKTQEATVPFDKVQEECRAGALLTKGLQTNGPAMQGAFAEFQRTANIKATRPEYEQILAPK